jgi:hypothetical protein
VKAATDATIHVNYATPAKADAYQDATPANQATNNTHWSIKNMKPQYENNQTEIINKPTHPCSQQTPNQQYLTDEKIKETIIETLIELNLVPKSQKKKVLTTE